MYTCYARTTFDSPQEFTQAAFNRVAELVSQHGQCALDNFVPAFSTEQCLEHWHLLRLKWLMTIR
jgi:hypothetical protein